MRSIVTRYLLFLSSAVLIFIHSPLSASEPPPLSFADRLFAEKDYYRAITEYKRAAHLRPETEATAKYMVALAYFRGEKWDAARSAFEQMEPLAAADKTHRLQARLLVGECAYRSADYASALDGFESFIRQYPDDSQVADARMRILQCYYHMDRHQHAQAQAQLLTKTAPHDRRIASLAATLHQAELMQLKSPLLAGSLSAILPGAGQLYTGRPRDAGISFLLNGGLITAALIAFHNDEPIAGSLVVALELTWYSGNIYGAVNSAHKYNRAERNGFINNLDFQCGIMKDADRRIMPAGAISIPF